MQTIYLLEDDEGIRELVLYALKTQFAASGYARPSDFWAAMKKNLPDLALLDIMLPEQDGVSILNRMRADGKTKNIPVIMLTAKTNEYDRVQSLDSGADDYITKPFSVLELVSRVKAVLRRSAVQDTAANMVTIGQVTLDADKHTITAGSENIALTYKEFELLKLLMLNQGIVFDRDQIMRQIWESDFEGETRTIDMHIKTLRRKLGANGNIIKTVRGIGYKAGE